METLRSLLLLLLTLVAMAACPSARAARTVPSESATTPGFWSSNINSIFTGESSWATSVLNEHLAAGAQLALDHCQDQFKWDRWNCPENAFSRRGFKPANQETAFVLAVTSAGVVHAVTRSCSAGNLPDCGCRSAPSGAGVGANPGSAITSNVAGAMSEDDDGESDGEDPTPPTSPDLKMSQQDLTNRLFAGRFSAPGSSTMDAAGSAKNDVNANVGNKKWVWSGCSDHVAYGESVAAKFLDFLVKKGNDAWAYTSLHNNRAGRLAVRDSMQKHCKCHGVSGSCSLQTCWMAVASFSKVAAQLRARYDHAIRIDFEAGHGKLVLGNSASGLVQRSTPPIPSEKLVYLEESPDYCKVNNTTGWTGTKGRSCSRNAGPGVDRSERRSCRELCRACGHKVRRTRRQVTKHCQCSFQWCCKVECKTCVETVKEHFCG